MATFTVARRQQRDTRLFRLTVADATFCAGEWLLAPGNPVVTGTAFWGGRWQLGGSSERFARTARQVGNLQAMFSEGMAVVSDLRERPARGLVRHQLLKGS